MKNHIKPVSELAVTISTPSYVHDGDDSVEIVENNAIVEPTDFHSNGKFDALMMEASTGF